MGGIFVAEPELFAPILGLGTVHEGDAEPEPAQAARWCRQVGPSAAKIHALCLGQRRVPQPGPPSRSTARAGRNDPCPCGSGKKYKRCCGARLPS